jgi:cyclopropane-fatty-acyl-phospholipid synthase
MGRQYGSGAVDVPWAVRLPDGRTIPVGDGPPRFTVVVRAGPEVAALALSGSMLAIGEAFIDGAFDIEGDFLAAMATAYRLAEGASQGSSQGSSNESFAALDSPRGSERRDVAAHYDLSNDFYALFLDRRMVYSCAYYPRPDATLDEAQESKLELACRKLALVEGERLLDLGCGWGGLLAWAAARHRVLADGVTLSAEQATWAARHLEQQGLAARAGVARCDLRDLAADGRYDKVASIGVIEHVGIENYPAYFGRVYGLLRPGGLLLNHGITHRTTSPRTSGMAFLDRYVFPGGDLATIEHTVTEIERSGFEVVHVEAIGRHYVPTLREWLTRLVAQRDAAIALVGERTYRIYAGYFAAAAVAFEAGWIDVHQILARRGSSAVRAAVS